MCVRYICDALLQQQQRREHVMEEHFILRVPPSLAERLDRALNQNPCTPEDLDIDLSFVEDGRTGSFKIGNDTFPAALLDMPCVLESYKTYDDTVLIKTADIGQMILVRDETDPVPESTEYKHGLTPPMRDARRRRFRREPDLSPEVVQKMEQDLINIMSGGTTVHDVDVEVVEHEEDADDEEELILSSAAKASTSGSKKMDVAGPSVQHEKSDSDDYD